MSLDLAAFQQITQRVPGVTIKDEIEPAATVAVHQVGRGNLALMRKAADATAAGFNAILKKIKPGVNERTIADALEFEYRSLGCRDAGV